MKMENRKILRQSNVELLRIICMVMVLSLHANFLALGTPNADQIIASPFDSFLRYLLEGFCIVAVDTFILISGWFGISCTLKGFLFFAFRCIFVGLLCVILGGLLFDQWDFSLKTLLLRNNKMYWFVYSYLGLYILAPVLNSFVENVSKKQALVVVFSFFLLQFSTSWYKGFDYSYSGGYSTISFIGLYLLSRVLRQYFDFQKYRAAVYFVAYFFFSVLISIGSCCFSFYSSDNVSTILFTYNCPFVIVSSLSLLLFFLRIKINYNKTINFLAASSFSAYLVHCHVAINTHYLDTCIQLYRNQIVVIPLFIIAVYLTSVILDRICISVWNAAIQILSISDK